MRWYLAFLCAALVVLGTSRVEAQCFGGGQALVGGGQAIVVPSTAVASPGAVVLRQPVFLPQQACGGQILLRQRLRRGAVVQGVVVQGVAVPRRRGLSIRLPFVGLRLGF